jgi:hypothetical protein
MMRVEATVGLVKASCKASAATSIGPRFIKIKY